MQAEAFPPGLGQGALGCNDVGLELDGISTCIGCRIDEGVCHAQAAVMGLADLGNNGTGRRVTWIVQPGIGHLDIGSIMDGVPAKHNIPAPRECLEQCTISGDNADLVIQPAGAGCPVAAAEQGPAAVAVLDQHKLVVHGQALGMIKAPQPYPGVAAASTRFRVARAGGYSPPAPPQVRHDASGRQDRVHRPVP